MNRKGLFLLFFAVFSSGCATQGLSPLQLQGIKDTERRMALRQMYDEMDRQPQYSQQQDYSKQKKSNNGNQPQNVTIKKIVVEKIFVVQQPIQKEFVIVPAQPEYQNAIYFRPWYGGWVGGYVPVQTGWTYPCSNGNAYYDISIGRFGHRWFGAGRAWGTLP